MYIKTIIISIFSLLVSGGFTWLMLPFLIKVSHEKQLLDVQDDRKVHHVPVPRLGGVAFIPALLVALCALCALNPSGFTMGEFCAFVAAMILIYVVGIYDDLMGVRYLVKIIVQVSSALMLCVSGLAITSFNGLFGVYELPVVVGWLLTIFVVVFVVNALNLIDGIDGLAASLAVLALLVQGAVLSIVAPFYAWLAAAGVGTLLAFLRYNVWGSARNKTKIFMGDGGSLAIGFLIAFLLLSMNREGVVFLIEGAPMNPIILGIAAVGVPCLDVVRVGMLRLYLRKHPFLPDRNHIHHCFLRLGLSHKRVVCYLLVIALGIIIVNVVLSQLIGPTWVFLIDLLLWLTLHLVLSYLVLRYERKI